MFSTSACTAPMPHQSFPRALSLPGAYRQRQSKSDGGADTGCRGPIENADGAHMSSLAPSYSSPSSTAPCGSSPTAGSPSPLRRVSKVLGLFRRHCHRESGGDDDDNDGNKVSASTMQPFISCEWSTILYGDTTPKKRIVITD